MKKIDIENYVSSLRTINGDVVHLKETTHFVRNLISSGFVTGSTFFDVDDNESDIDVVIPYEIVSEHICKNFTRLFDDIIARHNGIYVHKNMLKGALHYWQDNFESLYVLADGKIYNLILPFSELEYQRWLYATKTMKTNCEDVSYKDSIRDKIVRVKLFEEYKERFGE